MGTITPEQLLEHSDWLRGLAAGLVTDPATADDLVQETWLQALRAGGVSREGLRPWLARVLRNRAHNRRRSRVRRADRELLAQAERTDATPDELAQEAEAQRLIATAVARLEEPSRSLIVLRYFRGLDSGAIGRLRGVSSSTVRGQLRRALDQLRADLDRAHGGREAWSLVLLPVLRPGALGTPAAAAVLGVSLWLKLALVLAAGVLSVALGVQLLSEPASTPAASKKLARIEPSTTTPASPGAAPSRSALEATRRPVTSDGAQSSPDRAGAASLAARTPGEQPVVLRGRFLLPDGAPVTGMGVELSGTRASRPRERLHGLPESWEDPAVQTGEGGRFELSFRAPRAYRFMLVAKRPGFARDRWSWDELPPGTELDLGDVSLRPAGVIEGRLQREDGSPVLGESWRVSATEQSPPDSAGRLYGRETAELDPRTGTFRLEQLAPGVQRLSASASMSAGIEGPLVRVQAGETTGADFVHSGARHARRVVVVTRGELIPQHGYLAPGALRIVAAPNGVRTASAVQRGPFFYAFDDLAPGSYTVEIVDPNFLPWRKEAVRTGSRVRAQLVGSCSLELRWRTPGGDPVELHSITLEYIASDWGPPELVRDEQRPYAHLHVSPVVISAEDEGLEHGRLVGLLPGDYRLAVDGGAAGTRTLVVQGLRPGERRVLNLPAADPEWSGISGFVRRADGSPAAGVEVLLLRPAEEDDSARSPVLREGQIAWPDTGYRKLSAAVATDESGAFAFEIDGAGRFAVGTGGADRLALATEAFELEAGTSRSDIELILPAPATRGGRLVGPTGASVEGLRVLFVPGDVSIESVEFMQLMGAGRRVKPDGSFELEGPLSAGVVPYLQLPPEPRAGGRGTQRTDLDFLALDALQPEPGAEVLELRVLERFPGRAEVRVTSGGRPLPGVEVMLVRAGPTPFSRGRKALTDAESGVARILDFPGVRGVEIQDPASGWRYVDSAQVQVRPAGTTRLEFEVQLTRATLRLLDPEGRPLAGAAVQLTLSAGGAAGWVGGPRNLGPDGALELTLVPGKYRAYLLGRDSTDARAVDVARRSMFFPDSELPESAFTWSAKGAQVRF